MEENNCRDFMKRGFFDNIIIDVFCRTLAVIALVLVSLLVILAGEWKEGWRTWR